MVPCTYSSSTYIHSHKDIYICIYIYIYILGLPRGTPGKPKWGRGILFLNLDSSANKHVNEYHYSLNSSPNYPCILKLGVPSSNRYIEISIKWQISKSLTKTKVDPITDFEIYSPLTETEQTSGGGYTNATNYSTEVGGFNADASKGGILHVPVPPSTTTINTTTLQQTIISSLGPVSVQIWEQEQKVLENVGVNPSTGIYLLQASRCEEGLLTPAFLKALCSCSHITGSSDEIIVCFDVVVFIVVVEVGIGTCKILPLEASALKPSQCWCNHLHCFSGLGERGINSHALILIFLEFLSVIPGRISYVVLFFLWEEISDQRPVFLFAFFIHHLLSVIIVAVMFSY